MSIWDDMIGIKKLQEVNQCAGPFLENSCAQLKATIVCGPECRRGCILSPPLFLPSALGRFFLSIGS